MTAADWNLLVIASAEGKPLTPAQLQKSLFIIGKAFPEAMEDGYHFVPYDYGPFDAVVYRDAEMWESLGLVRVHRTGPYKLFAATPEGMEKAKTVADKADQSALAYAREVVGWILPLSFKQLVTAVYDAYPEMKANSIFKDRE